MTRGAQWFLGFLRDKANRNGQSWWGQQRMADELNVHRSTINRWVAELVTAGNLDSIRRGSTSNLYTLRKAPVENRDNVQVKATSVVAKCNNATLELNLEQGKEQAMPARKPPSSDVTNYRRAFGEEWVRLSEGWIEPGGRRVERQVRIAPNPEIMPVLADSARSVGLSPAQAILSLNTAVLNAEPRLNRARNPPGLIIHIARSIWKAS